MPPFTPKNGKETRLRKMYPHYSNEILEETLTRLANERLQIVKSGPFEGLEADAYLMRSLEDDISRFDAQISKFSRKKEDAEAAVKKITENPEYSEEREKVDKVWGNLGRDADYLAALKALDERFGLNAPKDDLQKVITDLEIWGKKKDSFSVALEMYHEKFPREKSEVQNRRYMVLAGTAAAGLVLGMLGGFQGSRLYSGTDKEVAHLLAEKVQLSSSYLALQKKEKEEKAKYEAEVSSNSALSSQYQSALSSMTALGARSKNQVNPLGMCDMGKLDVVSGSHFESYDQFTLESESTPQRASFSDKVHGCMRRLYLEDVLKNNLPKSVWSKRDALEFAHRRSQIKYSAGTIKIITKNGVRTVALPAESSEGIRSAYGNDFK